jgi:hypothetical protein
MWQQFRNDQVDALIVLGVAALVVQTIRRRWLAGTVVLLWGAVPLAIISAGTSKLYHYAYPFLPPIMLAAGYVCALVVMLAPAPLRRVLGAVEDWIGRRWPSYVAAGQQARGQTIAQAIVALAVVLAVGAVLFGHVRLHWGSTTLFRSSGIWRPMAVILLAALATRSTARVARVMVALVVLNTMPLAAYRGQLERMSSGRDPIRVAAACLVELERQSGTPAGLYVAMPEGIWHPLYYNFRRVRPWSTGESVQDPAIERHLFDPAAARPLLLSDTVWREWVQAHPDRVSPTIGGPPMIGFLNSVLLLPGPYAACSPEARLRGAQ